MSPLARTVHLHTDLIALLSARHPSSPSSSKREMPGSDNEENSPNVSNTTLGEELEDDERIDLVVQEPILHETLPNNESTVDDEPTAAKKKGKKPIRGKN